MIPATIRVTRLFPSSECDRRAQPAMVRAKASVDGFLRAGVVALVLLFTTASAHAQSTLELRVEPNPAPVGTPLRVRFVDVNAYCSGYVSSDVSRDGFVVTLTARYRSVACGTPPPGDLVLPLGRFGPGEYTLQYQEVTVFGPLTVQTTGFTVYPAASVVPTMQGGILLMLAALLAALGAWYGARRD
jgi:hypothetical protein